MVGSLAFCAAACAAHEWLLGKAAVRSCHYYPAPEINGLSL